MGGASIRDSILVCGAGPAGAMAALVLARAGARVRLVDRARFPREKLCGDTLNPGALAVLERRGVLGAASAGLPIGGMVVTGDGSVSVVGRYGDDVRGRSLSRAVLDAALLKAALDAGASFDEGVVIREPAVDGGTVKGVLVAGRSGVTRLDAGLTIAADGGRSRIARALGLATHPRQPRRWAVGAYFTEVYGLTDCGEMHVRRGHYIGVAPLPDDLANACVVSADRRALARPEQLLRETLAADPLLAERFARARQATPIQVLGPLAVESSGCGMPGLLLAGDAAGFIDPMTGDGLRFALRGAELAAACALEWLETGRAPHGPLAAARQREFGNKWRFNRTLRALVGSPLAVRAAAHGAAWAPSLLRQAIRYAGDLRAA